MIFGRLFGKGKQEDEGLFAGASVDPHPTSTPPPTATTPSAPTSPAPDRSEVPPEARALVKQMTRAFPGAHIEVESATLDAREAALGQDLSGDGKIGAAPAEDDHLGQPLTEQELAAEKARLLAGPG